MRHVILSFRILTRLPQTLTRFFPGGIAEVQQPGSSTRSRSQRDDASTFRSEMLGPLVRSRVEERHDLLRFRLNPFLTPADRS